MKSYMQMKQEDPEAIIFQHFEDDDGRDFFEAYDQDARDVAKALGLPVTTTGSGDSIRLDNALLLVLLDPLVYALGALEGRTVTIRKEVVHKPCV